MELNHLSNLYIIGGIIATAIGVALTRILPFLLLRDRGNSPLLSYLQETMPLLIMTLLVFFSLKDVAWSETYGIAQIGGILCIVLCFYVFKNVVLSMFAGIIAYIFLLQIF